MTEEQAAFVIGFVMAVTLLVPLICKAYAYFRQISKSNRILVNQSDADRERLNLLMRNIDPTEIRSVVMSDCWRNINKTEEVNRKAIERIK